MDEVKKAHHEALKEHMLYKTTQDVALTNAIRDAETAIEARENDASTLAETIQNLLLENNSSTYKINALQSDLQEYQLRMKQVSDFESKMRVELRQSLHDKQQREAEIVQIETRCSQESKVCHATASSSCKIPLLNKLNVDLCSLLQDIHAKNVLLDTELYGLRSEFTHMKQFVESTKLELIEARDGILQSKEAFKQVQKESSAKENNLLCMMKDMEAEKQRLDHTIKSLRSNIKESKIKFDADMELYRDELEEKRAAINRFQCEAISTKERTNREYQHSLHTLEIENASLKKKSLMLESELSISNAEKEQTSRNLNQATELCQHELNIALKKNIVLTEQNATLEDITKDAKQQYLALQTKLDNTTAECNAIRSEFLALENLVGDLSMQNEETSSTLRDQTEELLRERQAKESALKKSNHSEKIFQKEKRKSDAYKQKALEARAKNLLLKSIPK